MMVRVRGAPQVSIAADDGRHHLATIRLEYALNLGAGAADGTD
jgi:hypothetical protein